MEDEKKPVTCKNRPGLEERIRNTANLLAGFARENLDEESAREIIDGLADIIEEDEE